jgi:hypothetical protein
MEIAIEDRVGCRPSGDDTALEENQANEARRRRSATRDPGLSRFVFGSVEISFWRAEFQARQSGNLAGPPKKQKQARHPSRWLWLDSALSRLFFLADRHISSPAGLKFGRQRAGQAHPIRDSL